MPTPSYNHKIPKPNEQHFQSYRNWSRYHLLLCRSLAKWQSLNYSQWPRQQDHSIICGLYRNRKTYRRRSQKPNSQKPSQHHLRRQKTHRQEIQWSRRPIRYETLALQSRIRTRRKTSHCSQVQRRKQKIPPRISLLNGPDQNERSRLNLHRPKSQRCSCHGPSLLQRLTKTSHQRCWYYRWSKRVENHQWANCCRHCLWPWQKKIRREKRAYFRSGWRNIRCLTFANRWRSLRSQSHCRWHSFGRWRLWQQAGRILCQWILQEKKSWHQG